MKKTLSIGDKLFYRPSGGSCTVTDVVDVKCNFAELKNGDVLDVTTELHSKMVEPIWVGKKHKYQLVYERV
jgi:hypothetical protein